MGAVYSVALALLLLLPTLPVAPGGLLGVPGPSIGLGGPGSAASASSSPRALSVGGVLAQQPSSPHLVHPSASCAALVQEWLWLNRQGLIPPAVSGTDPSSCAPGPDELGVSYVSSGAQSGSRLEVTVGLPNASSYVASSMAAFFIDVVVSGVPCSLDGQSVLRIELIPPTQPFTGGPASEWQVRAPIFGLVPAGSCDPACQNSSAVYSIGGARFCLDDAVAFGPNARGGSPVATIAPGDTARFELGGGGSTPLVVYMNDSTRPARSTNWPYSAQLLASGVAPGAFGPTALAAAGWTYGGSVSVGWSNCPVVNHSFSPTSCNSYGGSSLRTLSYPRVLNVTYWNATRLGFLNEYPSVQTWSSSGACSGAPGVSACADLLSYGGAGVYPSLAVDAARGAAWLSYGFNRTNEIVPLANATRGLAADGSASEAVPSALTQLSATVTANSINLSVRATDPRGVDHVTFGALWCFNGGTSTNPTYYEFAGSEGPGVNNGSGDGNWTAVNLPRGSNTTGGTLYYWARLFITPSASGSPVAYGKATVSGTVLRCGPATPPPPMPVVAIPIASGYRVSWAYPASGAGGGLVRNYSVIAVPTVAGPSVVVSVPGPDARSAVALLKPSATYTLYVAATFMDGRTLRSLTSLSGSATLSALTGGFTVSSTALWEPNAFLNVTATAAGGKGGYCFTIGFGDAPSTVTCTATPPLVYPHRYGTYFGDSRVRVVVNDSVGDVTALNATVVPVRATPLGVAVNVFAGDGIVSINWSAPRSPTAAVSRYVVFFSSDPVAAADLTSGWPDNTSGPHPVYLVNTTLTSLPSRAVPNSQTSFVEVVAFDSFGAGLVAQTGPAVGRPAPLAVRFDPSPSGGPAPYTTTLHAIVTSGSPNSIQSAVFYSGLGSTTGPSVTPAVSTIGGTSWLNASYTFNRPGVNRITVHAVDALNEPAILTVFVYVGVGTPPAASLSVVTSAPYAGRPVNFQATVSGVGPFNVTWLFGDGGTALGSGTNPNATHTYASAGSFTVSVAVADLTTGGAIRTDRIVQVFATPSVAITAGSAGARELSYSFHATVTGGAGGTVIAWSFGDGAGAPGPDATHTYASPGSYTVRVMATDTNGVAANASVTIYAGVARTTVPLLGGTTGVLIVVVAIIGLVILAGTTAFFYSRSRRIRRLEGERVEPQGASDAPPEEPPGAMIPAGERPGGPPGSS